jgi:hypothetical protein
MTDTFDIPQYVPQTRPYSNDELTDWRTDTKKINHLSDIYADHSKCNHFYMVKTGGKKYKQLKENPKEQLDNCSVCWKFGKTEKSKKKFTSDFIDRYMSIFSREPESLTYDIVELEGAFYSWIYN